jgi:hypothetical protein
MSQVDPRQLISDPIAAAQRDDGSLSTKTTPINSRVQIVRDRGIQGDRPSIMGQVGFGTRAGWGRRSGAVPSSPL